MSVGPIKETHPSHPSQQITHVAGRYGLTTALLIGTIFPEADRIESQTKLGPDATRQRPYKPTDKTDKERPTLIAYTEPKPIRTGTDLSVRPKEKAAIQVQSGVTSAELLATLFPIKEAKQAYAEDIALRRAPRQNTEVAHA